MSAAAGLLPASTQVLLEMEHQEAVRHLEAHAAELRAQGLGVTAEVRRGNPEDEILKAAEACGAAVMALPTHGKAGTQAFWSGSLAARLMARFAGHLLLLPLPEERRNG